MSDCDESQLCGAGVGAACDELMGATQRKTEGKRRNGALASDRKGRAEDLRQKGPANSATLRLADGLLALRCCITSWT